MTWQLKKQDTILLTSLLIHMLNKMCPTSSGYSNWPVIYMCFFLVGRSCSWCVYSIVTGEFLSACLSPLATGDGDIMMRYCPSYRVVHLMREGLPVQDACNKVVLDMKQRHGEPFEVAIIALNMKVMGNW